MLPRAERTVLVAFGVSAMERTRKVADSVSGASTRWGSIGTRDMYARWKRRNRGLGMRICRGVRQVRDALSRTTVGTEVEEQLR